MNLRVPMNRCAIGPRNVALPALLAKGARRGWYSWQDLLDAATLLVDTDVADVTLALDVRGASKFEESMMVQSRLINSLRVLVCVAILPWYAAGCCCIQGVPTSGDCGMGCAQSSCGPAACGPGPLASLISCRGACGDVYVDEWVSEPPTVDNCGYPCGGCGQCGQCQPIRSLMRLLWGRPYIAGCSTNLCGPSCGCDSCAGGTGGEYLVGHGSHPHDCNCGATHHDMLPGESLQPVPQAAPYDDGSEVVPTPAPEISPTAARRLNPAIQHRTIRKASAVR